MLIKLSNSNLFAIIDSEFENLINYTWHIKGGYARTRINNKLVYMHHLIIGKPENGLVTDYKNRNKLDNRKNNLRHTTQRINMLNASTRSDNTTGYTGITFDRPRSKWLVRIGGKHIGRYLDLNKAIVARDEARVVYG